MAGRTGIAEWRHLYHRLTAGSPVGYEPYHPGAEAVEAAAKQFEHDIGYKLPRSYMAYAQVFGPGELGGYYRVAIPGDAKCGCDLASEHQAMLDLFAEDVADEQGRLRA